MNSDTPKPSREEIEVRLTALLLGELPPAEAELLRWNISQDAELARLHDQLKGTIGLVREATAKAAEAPAKSGEPLKLSEERRQKLLAQFKTVAPKEFAPVGQPSRRWSSWLVPLAAVLIIGGFLAVLLLPGVGHSYRARTANQVLGERLATADREEMKSLAAPVPSRPADKKLAAGPQAVASVNYTIPPPSDVPAVAGAVPVASPPPPFAAPIALPPAATPPEVMAYAANSAPVAAPSPTSTPAGNYTFGGGGGRGGGGGAAVPGSAPAPKVEYRALVQAAENINKFKVPVAGDDASVAGKDSKNEPPAPGQAGEAVNGIVLPQTPAPELPPPVGLSGNSTFSPLADNLPNLGLAENRVRTPSVAPAGGSVQLADQAEKNVDNEGNIHYAGAQQRMQQVQQLLAATGQAAPGSANRLLDGQVAPNANTGLPMESSGAAGGAGGVAPIVTIQENLAVAPDRSKAQVDDSDKLVYNTNTIVFDDRKTPVVETRKLNSEVQITQPEIFTKDNVLSTFSLNVSDVSYKLAAASLENQVMPARDSIRSEEFINAFDYRDPAPAAGSPIGFAWERAGDPFAHNRDLLRFSVKTAAQGREVGRPLNLVLLLDKSGSMERADRVAIIREALKVLAAQLQPNDTLSVVTFARTARLYADGVPASQAGAVFGRVSKITPQGGTNLEEAMQLAYQTALRHYLAAGVNRVVLMTDGAANLGDADPQHLKTKVETYRKQGVALDCFGIGWEDYNDNLLEQLSSHADGRYGFLNRPEEAATGFASQLAGALKVAAADVKVQVEFNPRRVTAYRQIGYDNHQLTKEQFRDNSVNAAVIGAAESGNAVYTIQINPQGDGPVASVRVRFRAPGTSDYQEKSWIVPYSGTAVALDQASPAMRLTATAASFAEWLAGNPYASDVTPDKLLELIKGVPAVYGSDERPQKLEWMIRQAVSLEGKGGASSK